jgi:hypothetical protein
VTFRERKAHTAVSAARSFLDIVWGDRVPDEAALAQALDALLAASHGVAPSAGADADLDPPDIEYQSLYAELGRRFPDLGYYPVADPVGSIDDGPTLADAIDDLADITRDLREVLWRGENAGPDDADWCFRLLYFHWGGHARALSLYLHARRFR